MIFELFLFSRPFLKNETGDAKNMATAKEDKLQLSPECLAALTERMPDLVPDGFSASAGYHLPGEVYEWPSLFRVLSYGRQTVLAISSDPQEPPWPVRRVMCVDAGGEFTALSSAPEEILRKATDQVFVSLGCCFIRIIRRADLLPNEKPQMMPIILFSACHGVDAASGAVKTICFVRQLGHEKMAGQDQEEGRKRRRRSLAQLDEDIAHLMDDISDTLDAFVGGQPASPEDRRSLCSRLADLQAEFAAFEEVKEGEEGELYSGISQMLVKVEEISTTMLKE